MLQGWPVYIDYKSPVVMFDSIPVQIGYADTSFDEPVYFGFLLNLWLLIVLCLRLYFDSDFLLIIEIDGFVDFWFVSEVDPMNGFVFLVEGKL